MASSTNKSICILYELACSQRSDSGAWYEVKDEEKNKEQKGKKVPYPNPSPFFLITSFCTVPTFWKPGTGYVHNKYCLSAKNKFQDRLCHWNIPFNLSIFKGVLNLSFQQTTPRETYSIWFSTDLIWGYLKWHFKTNWLWLVFLYCLVVNWVWGVLWPYHFLASHTI